MAKVETESKEAISRRCTHYLSLHVRQLSKRTPAFIAPQLLVLLPEPPTGSG